MKCGQPTPILSPRIAYTNRYIEIMQSKCPVCQTVVNRARARLEAK